MKPEDCKTVDEVLKWLGRTEEPYENIYMPNAVKALKHIAKLEYQRGLLRGVALGIEAAAMAITTTHMSSEIDGYTAANTARQVNPATVIAKEVK